MASLRRLSSLLLNTIFCIYSSVSFGWGFISPDVSPFTYFSVSWFEFCLALDIV